MKCPVCGGPMTQKRDRVGASRERRYYYQCMMCPKIYVPDK